MTFTARNLDQNGTDCKLTDGERLLQLDFGGYKKKMPAGEFTLASPDRAWQRSGFDLYRTKQVPFLPLPLSGVHCTAVNRACSARITAANGRKRATVGSGFETARAVEMLGRQAEREGTYCRLRRKEARGNAGLPK